MSHAFTYHPTPVPGRRSVIRLSPKEIGHVDSACIEKIFSAHPEDVAEEMLITNIDRMDLLLARIGSVYKNVFFDELPPLVTELSQIARTLGLSDICKVCDDFTCCLNADNAMGLAAVHARLRRMINRAPADLFQVREEQSMP